MKRNLKILGSVSIVLGCVASFLCLFPEYIFFAVIAGFLGMLTSTIYVFIDYKYDLSRKKFTPGVIGIILSSVPIVLIVLFNFITHFKNQ